MQHLSKNNQSGFVSLFSVIFFMLLITVVTIGFLRIMGIEQQQSINNDLTASAIAAAESGVEDGKRAILKYYDSSTPPATKTALGSAFDSNNCTALSGSAAIATALKLDSGGNIIGNTQLNQYYTCLTVSLDSPDYIGQATAGNSEFVQLRTTNPAGFDRMQVSWHLLSNSIGAEGDGIPTQYPPGPLLPPVINVNGNPANSWSTQGYPAYLRVQLFGYPNGSVSKADLDIRNRTMLLVPADPTNAAASGSTEVISMGDADPRGLDQDKSIVQQIQCIANPGSNLGSYACTALLEIPLPPTLKGNNNNYFMRVTPQYGQSHFRVALLDGDTPVNMREVQPIIDVTGRANDVYRRLQHRVRLDASNGLPEYVVESADTICKNLEVSDGSYFQPNNCP